VLQMPATGHAHDQPVTEATGRQRSALIDD
jgi:hypothetical protein